MENQMVVQNVFRFENVCIRVIMLDGDPWFVAKDVAEVLGYVNTKEAISRHCKGVAKRYPLPTAGGVQDFRLISESDMYRLVAHSQLPAAERFENWVYEEVLPQIRKTGKYEVGMLSRTAKMPEVADDFLAFKKIGEACELEKNQVLLAAEKAIRKMYGVSPFTLMEIELKSPDNEKYFTATQLGKLTRVSITPGDVNKTLQSLNFHEKVYRNEKDWEWRLTEEGKQYGIYLDVGKKHSDGTPIQQIKWKESIIPLLDSCLMV